LPVRGALGYGEALRHVTGWLIRIEPGDLQSILRCALSCGRLAANRHWLPETGQSHNGQERFGRWRELPSSKAPIKDVQRRHSKS